MQARTRDMTRGNPAKLIITFALPLMLGNVFQNLYTLVDTAIVGRFVGVEALSGLGAADWLNWLILGVITGFAQGFCILISQRFGAGDEQGVRQGMAMSVVMGGIIAVVATVISHIGLAPVLRMLNTPDESIGYATTYLRIAFSGLAAVVLYNTLSSALRAMGDSRTPLIAMVIASIVNVGLDLLFVVVFHWGVAGASIATVVAQLVSGLYCLWVMRRLPIMRMQRADWKYDGAVVRRLFLLGWPVAFQNGIIAVGGMAVQKVVNGFGFIFMAGFTATNKLYGLLEMASISYGYAVATYTGQNLGAGDIPRIKKGVRAGLVVALATSAVVTILMLIFGKSILSIFVSSSAEQAAQVLDIAFSYLRIMSLWLMALYILHMYRSALQGMGDTMLPMVSGILELVMRVACAFLLPTIMGQTGLFYAEVMAWVGAVLVLVPGYFYRLNKVTKSIAKHE